MLASRTGRGTATPQTLLDGLSLAAQAHHASGDTAAAAAECLRFFACWHEIGGDFESVVVLAELAAIPEQDEGFCRAAMLLPDAYRWKPALVAITQYRAADAAEMYHDIRSRPLEAAAHLLAARTATAEHRLADSTHHAKQALEFYQAVAATLYADQASQLLRASA
jgi:hypothetical protein